MGRNGNAASVLRRPLRRNSLLWIKCESVLLALILKYNISFWDILGLHGLNNISMLAELHD